MTVSKKKAKVTLQCVACGCCVKECPFQAISIYKGIRARVEEERCVGCGRCAAVCPAAVIHITERE